MRYFLLWILAANLGGAVLTVHDKRAAVKHARRVPEKTLFAFCALGGCPGVYLTMQLIRHKTRHKRFMIGIPVIFAAQCLALAAWMLHGRA